MRLCSIRKKVNKQRQKSFVVDKKRSQKAVNNAVFYGSLEKPHWTQK